MFDVYYYKHRNKMISFMDSLCDNNDIQCFLSEYVPNKNIYVDICYSRGLVKLKSDSRQLKYAEKIIKDVLKAERQKLYDYNNKSKLKKIKKFYSNFSWFIRQKRGFYVIDDIAVRRELIYCAEMNEPLKIYKRLKRVKAKEGFKIIFLSKIEGYESDYIKNLKYRKYYD